MDYLPIDKNELTKAIQRRDWNAVKRISKFQPNLVNTYDELHRTPLAHAFFGFHVSQHSNEWKHTYAPEDIIMILVENASNKCIESFCIMSSGVTDIIQLLALNSYVAPLKLVLEEKKRKVDVNTTSTRLGLRTPLHLCLGAPWCTFEQHKDTATCLVTYGASCILKDEYEDNAIDLYNKNECLNYDQKTKAEKKATLIKLLQGLSIPAAILAQGKKAVDSFKDEIKRGEITIVNCRSMFLGKEGAGKTSCVKAILGEQFDENEPSTDGIVTKTVFQTFGDDCSTWIHEDVDECERTKQIRDEAIAVNIADKLRHSKAEQMDSNTVMPSTFHPVASETVKPVTTFRRGNFDELQDHEIPIDASSISAVCKRPRTVLPMTQTFEMRKRVINYLINQGSSLSDVTSVWDYAGQLGYYITHRFFLTDGSCYCIVFSLLDNMDELAKPRDLYKGQFEMTNLQVTVFWIRSIYEFGILQRGTANKGLPCINGKIASPPICLVATHKDKLTGTEEEKKIVIEAAFTKIFADIKDKPYEIYVDREMYVVDNTNPMDEGIQKLKKTLGSYMKAMAKTVPISYVDLQFKLQEVGKSRMRIKLNEAITIADGCGIAKENTMHAINYLNDVGVLLHLPTNERLKNIVVTDVQMLIKIFMKIVTVVKPDDPDKKGVVVMRKFWEQLDKYGILDEKLLRHLLRNELADDEDADAFEVFVELLKAFSLLFEKKSQKESRTQKKSKAKKESGTQGGSRAKEKNRKQKESGAKKKSRTQKVCGAKKKSRTQKQNKTQKKSRIFIIPSRITEKTKNLKIINDNDQTESVYVIPKEFLPDAVYNVLVVKFLDKSQNNTFGGDHELFQNQAKIGFDNIHYLRIGVVCIHKKQALKIEITRLPETDGNGEKKRAKKPEPKTCKEIIEVLQVNLNDLYPSNSVDFGYTINILCPCFADFRHSQEPHFPNLIDCLQVKCFPCKSVARSTDKLWSTFKEETFPFSPDVERRTLIRKKPSQTSRELKELHFREFLQSFSKDYQGKNFRFLRFLLYGHLDIATLDRKDKSTLGLLNALIIKGHVSSSNVKLLSQIAKITGTHSAIKKVVEYKENYYRCNNDDDSINSGKLTQYRQHLFKALNAVATDELPYLIHSYQLEAQEFTNIWDVVFHLEKEKLLTEKQEKLERFAKLLNKTARDKLIK